MPSSVHRCNHVTTELTGGPFGRSGYGDLNDCSHTLRLAHFHRFIAPDLFDALAGQKLRQFSIAQKPREIPGFWSRQAGTTGVPKPTLAARPDVPAAAGLLAGFQFDLGGFALYFDGGAKRF